MCKLGGTFNGYKLGLKFYPLDGVEKDDPRIKIFVTSVEILPGLFMNDPLTLSNPIILLFI